MLDGPRAVPGRAPLPAAMPHRRRAVRPAADRAARRRAVPLAASPTCGVVEDPEVINHEDAERRRGRPANVRGRDFGSFVAEAQAGVAARVPLPPGLPLEWGGQFENQQRAMRAAGVLVPLSLGVIFLLLFARLRLRFGRRGLIMLNVPFALVGGIAALWLRGLNLTLSASSASSPLFGIAVLNGVVLVTDMNQLREAGRRSAGGAGRGAGTAQAGADDRPRGRPRLHPDGALHPARRRNPASAGDRRHRRLSPRPS